MSNQGVMKEIRIDIQSELAMNIINYLMVEENYVYVGNERDIWLENLDHPTVQLIYINQRNIFNEEQVTRFFKQIEAVRSRLRRRYLMTRLNVIVINLDTYSSRLL
ncbi:MAG: rhomboid family intramembrane serine protease, partial [Turicibacter sp.]|nr:rhomboid family intramembrane serine protease [Turicibacter sp.]